MQKPLSACWNEAVSKYVMLSCPSCVNLSSLSWEKFPSVISWRERALSHGNAAIHTLAVCILTVCSANSQMSLSSFGNFSASGAATLRVPDCSSALGLYVPSVCLFFFTTQKSQPRTAKTMTRTPRVTVGATIAAMLGPCKQRKTRQLPLRWQWSYLLDTRKVLHSQTGWQKWCQLEQWYSLKREQQHQALFSKNADYFKSNYHSLSVVVTYMCACDSYALETCLRGL